MDHGNDVGSYFQKSGIYIFLISSTCAYYLLNAPILLGHYDLGWHLAAGDLIRARGNVPFHDPWSFTTAGRQWFNLSWLWDAIASWIFQYANFSGLIFLTVACGAVIVAYLTSVCLRSGASGDRSLHFGFIRVFALPGIFGISEYLSRRLAKHGNDGVFRRILRRMPERNEARIFAARNYDLWANLHGGFLLGLFIIGVFGGVALLRRDWVNFKIYGFVGVACFIATFINPLGWHIYEGLTTVLGHFSQQYVTEWWPYYRNFTMPGSIPGLIYILIFIALELRDRGLCPIGAPAAFLVFFVSGTLSIQIHVVLFYFFDGSVGSSSGSVAAWAGE